MEIVRVATELKETDSLQLQQPTLLSSVRWKCMLCNRDKFTRKSPHKCKGGFRKHKIAWEKV